ncbi:MULTISPECIES: GRAS family protein [unclassified Streptomyces]|uniref:GRAS family protein n=1 Tax=unclassified Streptomyces TaxID=2593676 RepID=UPI002E2BC627|nr:GRAS family protein [Streptomyces sp. NBC_01439]
MLISKWHYGTNNIYSLLKTAAIAAESGEMERFTACLKQAGEFSKDGPGLGDYFLAGLAARLGQDRPANLYLRADGMPQIDLFYLMHQHLPFLRAGRFANDALLKYCADRQEATVLALGIGQGRQELDLVARAGLERVTVIGADVAAESLDAADRALNGPEVPEGTRVDFRPILAASEDTDESVWALVEHAPRPLLVTASFALHHMLNHSGEQDARATLLRRLRALEPAALALCEPDSDHHLVPLPVRLANAWHHYGTVFAAIDATSATDGEKREMKRFFGREIEDVVGAVCETSRFERHEPTRTWINRLTACGFTPVPLPRPAGEQPEGFTTTAHPTHLELAYKQTSVAAVIVAEPTR